ncbi:MAG: histidine kinase [Saprospiraceae bacterium]
MKVALIVVLLGVQIGTNIGQLEMPIIQKIEDKYNKLGASFQVSINPMIEDSLGYIWIGSKNGLCKYSGSTIDCYSHQKDDTTSLSGNNIENLFIDSRQHIWVAIDNQGINIFDIRGSKINAFKYNPNDKSGILANRVWGIFEDNDGYLWISYFSGGLSKYDYKTDKFEHFSIDSKSFLKTQRPKTVVKAIAHETEKNTFWLSTTRGLVKFNTRTQEYKSFLFYSKIKKKYQMESLSGRTQLESLWNRCMIKDRDGILWLGNFGGMVRFDPKSEEYKVIFNQKNTIVKDVIGIYDFDENNILFSQRNGLVLLDKNDFSTTILNEVIGIGDNYNLHVRFFKASNGCLYMINAQGKGGIFKTCENYKYVKDYKTKHYVENIIATDNYIHYYLPQARIESRNIKSGKLVSYPLELEKSSTIRAFTHYGEDTILFADFGHLYSYNPKSNPKRIKELDIENAYRYESLLVDDDRDIWSGRQRDGVYRYDIDNKSIHHYNHISKPQLVYQDYIQSIVQDRQGLIWIATEQGWSVFDKSTNTTKNYRSDDIAYKDNIDLKVIVDFVEMSNGNIWIADSDNGLIQWDRTSENVVRVINKSNGLKKNAIYDIELDSRESIWIASKGHLSYVDPKTNTVRNFGNEYGISKQVYCLDMGPDDMLYAGHSNGYYKIDINALLRTTLSIAKPVISGFSIFDTNQDSLLYISEKVELDYNQNFITFNFGSLNYNNPKDESYQYRLINLDENWINSKGARSKGYTGLDPGDYAFEVRIKTNDVWSTPAIKNITVLPPWYKTIWFSLLSFGFIFGICYLGLNKYLNYKNTQLEYEHRFSQLEMRILKSQMNPHFVFNSLNSIRYLFMKGDKEKGISYITKFAKLLRTTLNLGEQSLVKLDDEIKFTETFIALEQLRFDDKFDLTLDFGNNDKWKELPIPPFVIQPLVENAFWHGLSQSIEGEKSLSICIKEQGAEWHICIEDSGVGMNFEKPLKDKELGRTKSYGLSLIKERFALLNKKNDFNYSLIISESKLYESGTKALIIISSNIVKRT